MPKHTEGPWTAQPYSKAAQGFDVTTADPDGTIATVHPYHERETGTARAEADARLIAAAPDLLACVRELVREADTRGGHRRTVSRYEVDKARALLTRMEAP